MLAGKEACSVLLSRASSKARWRALASTLRLAHPGHTCPKGWGLAWKEARTRKHPGRMRQRSHSGLLKEKEAQGPGRGILFPLPPQRQTDGQTGEAGHREDSERWIWDKLKRERKQTEQLKLSPWGPPMTSPLPLLRLPSQHIHASSRPIKDAQWTKDSTEAKKREGRGLRSPPRTLNPFSTCPPALSS